MFCENKFNEAGISSEDFLLKGIFHKSFVNATFRFICGILLGTTKVFPNKTQASFVTSLK